MTCCKLFEDGYSMQNDHWKVLDSWLLSYKHYSGCMFQTHLDGPMSLRLFLMRFHWSTHPRLVFNDLPIPIGMKWYKKPGHFITRRGPDSIPSPSHYHWRVTLFSGSAFMWQQTIRTVIPAQSTGGLLHSITSLCVVILVYYNAVIHCRYLHLHNHYFHIIYLNKHQT